MFLNLPDTSGRRLFGGVQTIIEYVFGFSILFDIVTTLTIIRTGQFKESNGGIHPYINPVLLVAWSPWLWCIVMLSLFAGTIILSRLISNKTNMPIGIGLMVMPIIIEMNASVINLQGIISL